MVELLAAAACLLAALLQLAVHRSPDIVDARKSVTFARRIMIAALFCAAGYLVGGDPPPPATWILSLIGLSQLLFAAHNLKLNLHDGTHA